MASFQLHSPTYRRQINQYMEDPLYAQTTKKISPQSTNIELPVTLMKLGDISTPKKLAEIHGP